MPIIIREVVSEVALQPTADNKKSEEMAGAANVDFELLVRRASERVIEALRREWDR